MGCSPMGYHGTGTLAVGTVSEDPVSNLPAKITLWASLKTNDGPNMLGFYQLLNDEGLPVLA